MTKYEKYCQLRDSQSLTDAKVSQGSGVTRSTFTDWKQGRSEPKEEKLKKIAEFFGVPVSTFYDTEDSDGYYYNKETAQIAQEIFDNKELGLLMSASRGMKPEELKALTKFVQSMIQKEGGDTDS